MQIIGHRGARALFPENTLAGFEACLAMGLRHFELDVAVTRDGVAVVHHDPALTPDIARDATGQWISDATGVINGMGWEELQSYDVGRLRPGSRLASLFPRQVPMDGIRVPRLRDVLALPAEFLVELKLLPDRPGLTVSAERMVELAVEAAREAGAVERCVFQSFDWRAMRHVRRRFPGLRCAWLTSPATEKAAAVWWGIEHPGSAASEIARESGLEGHAIWTPEHAGVTAKLVAEAHRLRLSVVPWTVNDPARVVELRQMGVDGVITDDPPAAGFVAGTTP